MGRKASATENEPGSCIGCEHLRITHDLVGTEARCMAFSKKGRYIDWQYGGEQEDRLRKLQKRITNRCVPNWCLYRREV